MRLRSACVSLLLFRTVLAVCSNSSIDGNSDDCNGQGKCMVSVNEQPYCDCYKLYEGDDCSVPWKENRSWNIAFYCYSAFTIVTNVILLAFASYQLWITFKTHDRVWARWTMVTHFLILTWVASLFRIVNFAVDAHSVRGVLPKIADDIMFNVPLIMWNAAAYCIFLYWIELQRISGIHELLAVTKLRPLLIAVVIITAIVLIPANVIGSAYNNPKLDLAYQAFILLNFILLISLSGFYGVKLMRLTKKLYKSTKITRFKVFLKKITRFVFAMDATLIASIFSMVIYILIGAAKSKFPYVAMHWVFRAEEFSLVLFCLLFVNKKRPSGEKTTEDSVGSGSRMSWRDTVSASEGSTQLELKVMKLRKENESKIASDESKIASDESRAEGDSVDLTQV